MENNNVICLESSALENLIDHVVKYIKTTQGISNDKWINTEQAMELLNITSKTTLQNLRDTGKIRFTQPMKKVVLYDKDSLLEYLDKHTRNIF